MSRLRSLQLWLLNWFGWIIVDAFAISLYANHGLGLTAGLYVLFLILSIAGLVQWLRAEEEAKRAAGRAVG